MPNQRWNQGFVSVEEFADEVIVATPLPAGTRVGRCQVEPILLCAEFVDEVIVPAHEEGNARPAHSVVSVDEQFILELAEAIEKLTAKEKAIIALSQMGRTRPQIAKQLGVSPKIVGQWMASARDHLASNVS